MLCRRNVPVAELRSVVAARAAPRPVGLLRDRLDVPDSFFEPLPLDEDSCLLLPRLPSLHRDPFDRILVCQAMAGGLVLLTPDPEVTRHPVRTDW